jgi:hypothetical protein
MRTFGKAYLARVIEGENIPALSARKGMKKSGEAGFFRFTEAQISKTQS